ncbi:MAG: biopolymer transporter ExbD [Fibrobacteres bacterium]|nr:biopolymer transporter ExbD [Fibrobacterota bacterium]
MKIKTDDEADVNVTSLIDCLMQCIIFFMVIMSAQYIFGVAIKFPPAGGSKGKSDQKQEKNITVYVQSDYIEQGHYLVQDGMLKLNGEDIALTSSEDRKKWEEERKKGYEYLTYKIGELVKSGYNDSVLLVQGDMTTYHTKIMHVVDCGKANKIKGFSLLPPVK